MATATQRNITCGNCAFYNHFESANLARVERVKVTEAFNDDGCEANLKFGMNVDNPEDKPDYEFNVWTKHDCHGTEYQNSNRTWFYFGVKPDNPGVCLKFNVVNLNRQSKMFSQGMCPVFKTLPGHPHWERIRDKPTYAMDRKGSEFTLSFVYRTPDNPKAISYLAFTYPFTYQDLENYLEKIDNRMAKRILLHPDDVYYHRECAIKSLEGRRMDLLTISSFHDITTEREERLPGMFPDTEDERAFKFCGKKIVLMSARVHPGETPSSFVFNGFLNFLINRDDPTAVLLRRIYVFKLIPMLNPDGVARGHYRMDTRGVNLNRVYLEPSPKHHPTIFAARSLIRYYHNCYKVVDEDIPAADSGIHLETGRESVSPRTNPVSTVGNVTRDSTNKLLQQVTLMTLDETNERERDNAQRAPTDCKTNEKCWKEISEMDKDEPSSNEKTRSVALRVARLSRHYQESGLFLYIDMHGHASKKGIFMYGNYFDDLEDTVTCMLLPKLMSINNPNFHFASCSFAERNMYLVDKRDGMSREGSGRVAVYKLTGLVRSYTLECNYNSGRLVNALPARLCDGSNKTPCHAFVPPKYTPTVFEEVGAALGPSILDLTNSNPNSRLPNSQFRSLRGVRSFLRLTCINNHGPSSINGPRNKDNSGTVIAKEAHRPVNVSTSVNNEDNVPKSETNTTIKPPRMMRRTTSLYAAIKRMRSGKKSRQVVSRGKCPKSQGTMNVGNSIVARTIKTSNNCTKTTLPNPARYRTAIDTDLQNIDTLIVSSSLSCNKEREKKIMSKITIERTSIQEETTVIKQGSKRLKIFSPEITKIRPEIGESSKTTTTTVATSTMSDQNLMIAPSIARFRDKQISKNTFGRCRKSSLKNETKTKVRKSAKLKSNI